MQVHDAKGYAVAIGEKVGDRGPITRVEWPLGVCVPCSTIVNVETGEGHARSHLFDGPGTEEQLNAVESLAEAMFTALPPFGWVAPLPWAELNEGQRSTWRDRAERWIEAQR